MVKKTYRRPDATQIELDANTRMFINCRMSSWGVPGQDSQVMAALRIGPVLSSGSEVKFDATMTSPEGRQHPSGFPLLTTAGG